MFRTSVKIGETRYTHNVTAEFFLSDIAVHWNTVINKLSQCLGVDISNFPQMKVNPSESTLDRAVFKHSLLTLYQTLSNYFLYKSWDKLPLQDSVFDNCVLVKTLQNLKIEEKVQERLSIPSVIKKYFGKAFLKNIEVSKIVFQSLYEIVAHSNMLLLEKHKVEGTKFKKKKHRLLMIFSDELLEFFLEFIDDFHNLSGFDCFLFLSQENDKKKLKIKLKRQVIQHKNGLKLFNKPIIVTTINNYISEKKKDFIDSLFVMFSYTVTHFEEVYESVQNMIILENIIQQVENSLSSFRNISKESDLKTTSLNKVKQQLLYLYPTVFIAIIEIFERCIREYQSYETNTKEIALFFLQFFTKPTNNPQENLFFDSIKANNIGNQFSQNNNSTKTKLIVLPGLNKWLFISIFTAMKKNITV